MKSCIISYVTKSFNNSNDIMHIASLSDSDYTTRIRHLLLLHSHGMLDIAQHPTSNTNMPNTE